MKKKTATVEWSGRYKKVEIVYTFSYRGRVYAFAGIDPEKREGRIIELRYNPFDGLKARSVSEQVIDAAEAVYNYIVNYRLPPNGKHYKVYDTDEEGCYRVKPSCRLIRLSPIAVIAAIAGNLIFPLVLSTALYYWYVRDYNDWILLAGRTGSERIAKLGILAVSAVILLLLSLYARTAGKRTNTAEKAAFIIPPLTVICFGLAARMSVRLVFAGVTAAFVSVFIARLFALRKKRAPAQEKNRGLDRLLKRSRAAAVLCVLALSAFSLILGQNIPYHRNVSVGALKARVIESRFEKACANLDEDWNNLSEYDKIKTLQAIFDYEAFKNGTFSAKVAAFPLSYGGIPAVADYAGIYNAVRVDPVLALENPVDAVSGLVHEYRHCMQDYIANYAQAPRDEELAKAFRENINDYKSVSLYGYERYRSQLIEVDARWYSYEKTGRYLQYFTQEDIKNSSYNYRDLDEDFILNSYSKSENWEYAVSHPYYKGGDTSGDYITLTRYLGKEKEVTLPDTIDGVAVKSLAGEAFARQDDIEKVYIPANIEKISGSAFDDCEGVIIEVDPENKSFRYRPGMVTLAQTGTLIMADKRLEGTVLIPRYVSEIREGAFDGCKNITGFMVESGNRDFYSKSGVLYRQGGALVLCPEGKKGKVVIADGCTSIGSGAFRNCENVSEIVIPPSVKEIGPRAFAGCSSIHSLTVPATVEKTDTYAFEGLDSLKKLSLPLSLAYTPEKIPTRLVILSPLLEEITFEGNSKQWEIIPVIYRDGGVLTSDNLRTLTVHCKDCDVTEYV